MRRPDRHCNQPIKLKAVIIEKSIPTEYLQCDVCGVITFELDPEYGV